MDSIANALIDAHTLIFFLVFARIMAMVELAPVFSGAGIGLAGRAGLAFFTAAVVAPGVIAAGYPAPQTGLDFAMLLLLEAMIGIVIGFFLVMIFAILHGAGQMFSMQIGFSASEALDPVTQSENTVIGQLLNYAAFLIFFTVSGMQKLFLAGVEGSFNSFTAASLAFNPEPIMRFIVSGLAQLFVQSLAIAMPLVGALFLISIAMGLLAKAAPQMNLLMVGLPIQIAVGLMVLILALPMMLNAFNTVLEVSWRELGRFFLQIKGSS